LESIFSQEFVLAHTVANPADAQQKKAQRAEDGKKAMAEYQAERVAVREQMAKLRELRLAREAEEQQAPPVTRPAPRKKAASTRSAPRKKAAAQA
jgi:hypothetical protein